MPINVFKNLGKKGKSGGKSSPFSAALQQANDEFAKINNKGTDRQLAPVAPAPTFLGATPAQAQASKKFDTTLSAPTPPPPELSAQGSRVDRRANMTALIDKYAAQQSFSDIIKQQFAELDKSFENLDKTFPSFTSGNNPFFEAFETATLPLGIAFGGVGNLIAPIDGSSGSAWERFVSGAKGQAIENAGFTNELPARQQLGGRIVRSSIDPIQAPDLSGKAGSDIKEIVRFGAELPKELFAQSLILGINILADPETYIGFKGAKSAGEALEFTPKITKALKDSGLLEEASDLMRRASKGISIEDGDTSLVVDNFIEKLSNSPNGERILQVLGEQSGELSTPTTVPNPQFASVREKLDQLIMDVEGVGTNRAVGDLGDSASQLEKTSKTKRSISGAVEGRIPQKKNITISEKAILYKSFKDQERAARAGAREGTREATAKITETKKDLSRFIQDVIPDTSITRAQVQQLVRDTAMARTPAEVAKVKARALSIADTALRKDLISDVTKKINESIADKPRFTPGQLQRAKTLQGSDVYKVAQREQDAIVSILDYINTRPVGAKKKARFQSAEAFLKRNPDYDGLPSSVVEGIAGLKKRPITELSTEELLSLSQKVDEFIARGKVRSRLMASTRGRTIDQALDKIEEGSVNIGRYAKNSKEPASLAEEMVSIYETYDLNSLTTQNLADMLDGNVWIKSSGRQYGPNYEHFVLEPRKINDEVQSEGKRLLDEFNAFFADLNLSKEEQLRVGVYAYSKQPGLRKQLVTQLKKRGISVGRDIKLTAREQAAYDFMRGYLDSVKPELDAVSMETRGSRIGFIDNYFPISREIDDFRGVQDVIEGNVRLTPNNVFKQTAEFGSLKQRQALDLADADIELDPIRAFIRYMDAATYYKGWEPWLATTRAMVGGKDSRYAKIVGEKGHYMMSRFLERIARRGAKENPFQGSLSTLDKVSSKLKRNLAVAYMVRGATVAKQFTGGLVGGARIGHRWVLDGWSEVLTNPEMRRFAHENSLELKHRTGADLTYAEVERQFALRGHQELPKHKALGRKIDDSGRALLKATVEQADYYTAQAVWIGAYKKALSGAAQGNQESAIRYADDIVNQTQASGNAKDISRFQNLNETLNSVVFPFSTFAINQWNLIRASLIQSFGKDVKFLDRASGAGMLLSIAAAVAAEQAVEFALEDPDYRADNILEHWRQNLPRAIISSTPIIGNVINAVDFGGASFQPITGREVDRTVKGVLSFFDDPLKSTLQIGKGAGALIGLPVNLAKDMVQISKFLGSGLLDLAAGALPQALESLGDPGGSVPDLGQPPSVDMNRINEIKQFFNQ